MNYEKLSCAVAMIELNTLMEDKILNAPNYNNFVNFKNVLVIGVTGSGKSNIIDLLMGENVTGQTFDFASDTVSCNFYDSFCQYYKEQYIIRYIDSIGLMDTIVKDEALAIDQHYVEKMQYVNTIILTFKKDKLTPEIKKATLEFFKYIKTSKYEKNIIIVITHCNKVDEPIVRKKINTTDFFEELSIDFENIIIVDIPKFSHVIEYYIEKNDENYLSSYLKDVSIFRQKIISRIVKTTKLEMIWKLDRLSKIREKLKQQSKSDN